MTGTDLTVCAEWALRGKTSRDRGYRLLYWSDGTLGKRNFEEALQRYSPGTLEHLPQVTMSYVPPERQDLRYLAIAVHTWAREGDREGRPVEITSFFCVSYDQLAANAISYQAMHRAFSGIRLPTLGGVPVKVKLAKPERPMPVSDQLPRQVAALLLAERPVCILGAGNVDVADRLAFIDSVMSLLPYGMRRRMAASTWVNSTYREHKFRLFFTGTPRETADDYLAYWGQPERTPLAGAPGYVHDYLAWLEDRIWQPVASLAEQTEDVPFRHKDVLQMLERNRVPSQSGDGYPAGADDDGDEQDLTLPTPPPPAGRRKTAGIAGIVDSCAERISASQLKGLQADIKNLESYISGNAPTPDEMRECREVIAARRLLAPQSDIPSRDETSLYSVLLGLAFGKPLTYEAYCQLEDSLGNPAGTPPHRALLEAIDRGGPRDTRVLAIVQSYLGEDCLSRSFHSDDIHIARLVASLIEDWPRTDHARIVCDVARKYLRVMDGKYKRQDLMEMLHKHGYLAPVLQARHPHDVKYQTSVLVDFLRAAYPDELDRNAVSQILARSGKPPTAALLIAVLRRIGSPADAAAAKDDYLRGQLGKADMDPTVYAHVNGLLGVDSTPGSPPTAPLPPVGEPDSQPDKQPPRPDAENPGAVPPNPGEHPGERHEAAGPAVQTRKFLGVALVQRRGFPDESEARSRRNR